MLETTQTAVNAPRARDPRLDFFRGIAMLIILTAHTPGNFFNSWIPARWGFSDATEMFVFCSGMASAIAFGGSYARRGWVVGTVRVLFRIWQVYWVHIGLFIFIAMMMASWDVLNIGNRNYVNSLNLLPFFDGITSSATGIDATTQSNLIGLMTLSYVPNYFDILPMYIAVLCLLPVMVGVASGSVWLAFALSITLWVYAQGGLWAGWGTDAIDLHFNAEPWSNREWFFNPFGWQLIFFSGFAFMRGWLPKPPINTWLAAIACLIVIANIPLSDIGVRFQFISDVNAWRSANEPWFNKTDFGILRFVQFLCLAYLGYVIAGEGGSRLLPKGTYVAARIWTITVRLLLKVGQQSLAIFVFSMVFGRVLGLLMDVLGRSAAIVTLTNLMGWGVVIVAAYFISWIKSLPWKGGTKA